MTKNELIIQKVRELAILLSTNDDICNHGHLVDVTPADDIFTCDLDEEECQVLTVRIDLEKI